MCQDAFKYNIELPAARRSLSVSTADDDRRTRFGAIRWQVPIHAGETGDRSDFSTTFSTLSVKFL